MIPLKQRLTIFFARGLGLGNLPKMPGTFGSLLGLPTAYALTLLPGAVHIALLLLGTYLAYRVIAAYEREINIHDDARIVLDEWLGQSWTLAFCPVSIKYYCLGFVIFRLLDIVKPWPISAIDAGEGSLSTLMDDVVAGVLGAGLLYVASTFLWI